MNVGICHITLRLADNHSLKGKRQVIKSITARLQNQFNVSVAEVEDNDLWQSAGIGVSCVSNEAVHAAKMLESVVEWIERNRPDVEITHVETEVISA